MCLLEILMEYNGMKICIAPDETLITCKDQETVFGRPDKIKITLWHNKLGAQDKRTIDFDDLLQAYFKVYGKEYL